MNTPSPSTQILIDDTKCDFLCTLPSGKAQRPTTLLAVDAATRRVMPWDKDQIQSQVASLYRRTV